MRRSLLSCVLLVAFAAAPAFAAPRHREAPLSVPALVRAEPGSTLSAVLSPDARLTLILERRSVRALDSFTWRGRVGADPHSMVTIVAHRGAVCGSVRRGDGRSYRIRSRADGGIEVVEVAPAGWLPCGATRPRSRPAPAPPAAPAGPGDDGSTIDVMVVYTPAARAGAGGSAMMEAFIQLAVDEANTVLFFSLAAPRLRLVHTAETAYVESNTGAVDLAILRASDDGEMDEVHALRDEHQADLVALIVNTLNVCGTGYLNDEILPSNEQFGFSVVLRGCAVDNLSLLHELGHNMGCGHDRVDGLQGVFDFSYGLRSFAGNFRTVMATGPAMRIPRFSNPRAFFAGTPTGVPAGQPDAADHASTLDATALVTSNYRVHRPACPADVAAPEDDTVDAEDVFAVLDAWGRVGGGPADVDDDGVVNVTDLLAVLAAWGACGEAGAVPAAGDPAPHHPARPPARSGGPTPP